MKMPAKDAQSESSLIQARTAAVDRHVLIRVGAPPA